MQLVLQELKSDVASLTTHGQTCLAINQVVAGCEKLLQKVESNSTFCDKICLCCPFYRPVVNAEGPFFTISQSKAKQGLFHSFDPHSTMARSYTTRNREFL